MTSSTEDANRVQDPVPPPADAPPANAAAVPVNDPAVSPRPDEERSGQVEAFEEEDAGPASDSEPDLDIAAVLADAFQAALRLQPEEAVPALRQTPTPLLSSFDLAGVAELIASGTARRVIVMCGAGISVSAGIPDFRTPGTGLYSRLQEYNLPTPEAVFEIDFFRKNPNPFFMLARELFPGRYAPTPTHHFIKLLHDKGLLLRCYTQNIDSLERVAGLPREAVIAAHGNFDTARCVECRTEHDVDHVRSAVDAQVPAECILGGANQGGCGGLVKPDIVFFGENLPERFWNSLHEDFEAADLLIVLGTSLVVHPFASLIDRVGDGVPRLLINRERVGEADPALRMMGYMQGFNFGKGNYRDALYEGDCDAGVQELCRLLGWDSELQAKIQAWKAGDEHGNGDAAAEKVEDAGPAEREG